MDKNISRKISVFKWVLTIGMVQYHARHIYGYNLVYNTDLEKILVDSYVDFANHVGFVCMVFFFFTSGFLFYYNAENLHCLFKKIYGRIHSLLIPFILWNIIIFVYEYFVDDINFSFYNLCDAFFFDPSAGPLWYLLALLLLMVFAPIFVLLRKHKRINTILFAVILIWCILRNFNVITPLFTSERWWWYSNMIYYLPIYLIGAYIGIYYPKIIVKNRYDNKVHIIYGVILLMVSMMCWEMYDNWRLYGYYSLIELIGLWLCLRSTLFDRELPSYYACSFYIFALHNPVLIPHFRALLQLVFRGITINGYVMVLIKIVELICIVVTAYLISIVAKFIFSEAIYNGLSGGRK